MALILVTVPVTGPVTVNSVSQKMRVVNTPRRKSGTSEGNFNLSSPLMGGGYALQFVGLFLILIGLVAAGMFGCRARQTELHLLWQKTARSLDL